MNHIERLEHDRINARFDALEKRINELEQKWKDQETEISVGCTNLVTKDYLDQEISWRLRSYKHK
jgi:hypothetical protein